MIFACVVVPSLLACGGLMSKQTECNNFINAVNTALPTIQKISQEQAAPGDIKALSDQMRRIGDEYKKLSTQLDGMSFTDETLKGKVEEYKRMTRAMSDTTHRAAVGTDKLNLPALNRVQNQMSDLAKDESRLVDDINKYCSGS